METTQLAYLNGAFSDEERYYVRKNTLCVEVTYSLTESGPLPRWDNFLMVQRVDLDLQEVVPSDLVEFYLYVTTAFREKGLTPPSFRSFAYKVIKTALSALGMKTTYLTEENCLPGDTPAFLLFSARRASRSTSIPA